MPKSEKPRVIAREKELKVIDQVLRSKEAELIAIWGRRRIGKTFLVRHGRKVEGPYLEVIGQNKVSKKKQLANFTKALSKAFYAGQELGPIRDWGQAFSALETAIENYPDKKAPISIFFDEAAWLDSPKSGFLNALEYFWNSWGSSHPQLKLFVCSSASSWILNKILQGKAGWHRRVTKKIHLHPFTLSESKRYLASRGVILSKPDMLSLYMIVGGTAAYLKQVNRGDSLSQIVENLFFDKDAYLADEYQELFYSLFNSAEQHMQVIEILATKKSGYTQKQIREKGKLMSGKQFTQCLKNLTEADFIERYTPFNEAGKTKRRYRLTDYFSLFYLSWIVSEKLESRKIYSWKSIQESPSFKNWAGFAFENVVWQHIDKILAELGLSKMNVRVSPCSYNLEEFDPLSAKIDLILDVQGAGVYILEVKNSFPEFVLDQKEKEKLVRHRQALTHLLANKRSVFVLLLAAHGVKENKYTEEIIDKIIPPGVLWA